jgi:hypothetical protein
MPIYLLTSFSTLPPPGGGGRGHGQWFQTKSKAVARGGEGAGCRVGSIRHRATGTSGQANYSQPGMDTHILCTSVACCCCLCHSSDNNRNRRHTSCGANSRSSSSSAAEESFSSHERTMTFWDSVIFLFG